MASRPDESANWGTCNADDCDEPAPWDMKAVLCEDSVYCSPDCANGNIPIDAVVYCHDPQFHVDRGGFGANKETVNIFVGRGPDIVETLDKKVDVVWRVGLPPAESSRE